MSPPDVVEAALPTTLRPIVRSLVEERRLVSNEPQTKRCLPHYLIGTEEEQILIKLLEQYCSGIGFETMHVTTDEERQFFIDAADEPSTHLDQASLLWCLEQVARAGAWEHLLSKHYPTCRRFSLEGLEAGVLALNTVVDSFAQDNVTGASDLPPRVVLGTLHRGRVNILHTVLQKSVHTLFREWDATKGPTYDDINLGHSADVITKNRHDVHVSLLSMPAHLESQDPALAGKARGDMVTRILSDTTTADLSPAMSEMDPRVARSILPLVVHGDASFCGEGIVSETLQLSTYADFDCGGTVHVIFNNQIGFTSEYQNLRSSRHGLVNVSDLALGIRAPVLHVNAERPLDVHRAARLATQYRQRFRKDIVLDLWGYRKHGHNEMDDPRITNVSLYKEVDGHEPAARVFAKSFSGKLRQEGDELIERVEAEYQLAGVDGGRYGSGSERTAKPSKAEWVEFLNHPSAVDGITGVSLSELKTAATTISTVPDGFEFLTPTLRAVSRRAELAKELNKPQTELSTSPLVDWATAELLALTTLAHEGHFCRLSGQDSQRGTFSQRHAVWHDAVTGEIHNPLPKLVQVVDSPLSELGVMGFEHGMSLASPNFLILWEAQFADFSNNGQVLIDTMLTSEKERFGLDSNLVLLLPHGYDGMGPEHSSSRLERFLTMHTDTPGKADDIEDDLERFRTCNFTVVYPTNPSNYFHVLRRSFSWPFRRPMVVLSPKRTLRLTRAASPLQDFLRDNGATGTSCFAPVLDDPRQLDRTKVRSIAFCSGEVFYDMQDVVDGLSAEVSQTVAILRVEQLAPFPLRQCRATTALYPRAERAVWVQEEPRNMGAARFTAPFLSRLSPTIQISNPISRPVSAAPAVGNPRDHEKSQRALLSRITDWIEVGSSSS